MYLLTKTNLVIATAIVVTGSASCNNSVDMASKYAASLTQYIDSVASLDTANTVANWKAIDEGYQERAIKAEENMAMLEAAEKAKAEESKVKYAALRAANEARLKELEAQAKLAASIAAYRQMLRDSLFGPGRVGPDLNLSFVTKDNVVDVYKKFVNTVARNKKNYTKEDWDDIKLMYKALNERKNEVEKDLYAEDNLKITELKIRFTSIKTFNQGGG